MPELPEVETVRQGLVPAMEGAVIDALEQRRPDLRFPFPAGFAERLTGRTIIGLGRRAKYLLADLDDGALLIMHLGMSGSFRVEDGTIQTPGIFYHPRDKQAAHDHVVFHLSNGKRVVYNDPRRFGFMDLVRRADIATTPHLAGLGIEPVGNAFDGVTLHGLFAGKRTPLKAALLDQRLVAGLGNIYVCEALHMAGLSPERAAGTITAEEAGRLATAIREVLGAAIAAGGSSLRDHRQANGELGYFQHSFRVYDREGEPCPNLACSGVVTRTVQSGRSTFHCLTCQR
ncbi:bifunctional DNA-formamidopyrimidine glycosylase/DNA-(apurinic or apyrimidinic site) lyase [Kaistia dalseonensis]|uniref:Formamidopyrimidine-DNA glycosylase n=1 Tax=Kaistia dalseonensis TaxID=410840 RepID=A0ABU0H5G4_9HYPH|nr:bifunctional DNA-formamidopyrimidine glycosylase/DNA-(apurinic or apyrimidinic site) lyase [Kaistia dalseonensis]MCX5494973.1 bifunctional DNA-formamidopyrimidine glycosylase/DNA-(apurinic or apyrimidinic site) lyase [Kaistia dalseonensis]MDQ0437554.1 formamidopyrimidine-DNA glycosylase [Kaistia dalseonensis]